MASTKPRILFTSPVIQYPPHGGPALRIANTIKVLGQSCELTIACRETPEQLEPASCEFLTAQARRVLYPEVKRPSWASHTAGRLKRRLLGGASTSQVDPREDLTHIFNLLKQESFDAIWLGYGNISYPLLRQIKDAFDLPVILDTDSVWSRFVLRGLPFAKTDEERERIQQEGQDKEAEERWGTQLADVTTAVSEVDAEYYRGLTDDPDRVHVFSNVVDVDAYEAPSPPEGFAESSVFLAGTFWPESPMEQAARWFIEKVLPTIRQTHSRMHLYVVGKDSDSVLSDIRDPNITITGRVPSVLPYLCNVRAAIVPLWFESGTRFKILEAGAVGQAVVSTTLGAEGIPVTHDHDILLADEPEEFAKAVTRLLDDSDLARKLSGNLKQLVCEQFGLPKLHQEAQSILDHVLAGSRVATN